MLPSGGQCVSGYVAVFRLPCCDLVEVGAGAPEAGGERPLGVLLAPVGAAVEDLGVDGDAGGVRLVGEHGDQVGQPGRVVGREQVDAEVLLSGLGEQRHGLLDVLLALGEVRVAGVERAVHVVADRP